MAFESLEFVGALIDEGKSAQAWIAYGNLAPMFITDWEKNIHQWIAGYIQQNGVLPTRALLTQHFDDPFQSSGASGYVHAKMVDRYLEHIIRSTVEDGKVLLDFPETKDPKAALELFSERIAEARMASNPNMLINSVEALPLIWQHYKSKLKLTDWQKGLLLGWPDVDKTSGGIEGGEVISLVGRPATGKTWFLLWIAMKGWEQARRCAFVTMEMPGHQIIERQLGIATGTDYGPIKSKTKMGEPQYNKIESWLKLANYQTPFFVVDSRMASTVPDIETYCRAISADVIYIDGAYLLRHADSKLNRYNRVAENMDLIKDMAMRMNVPVICSWQFNREAAKKFKKKTSEDPDLEDIGYSDAIGQHSSIILGLLQDENLATIKHRQINILKGRGGEQGIFHVAWDFINSHFGKVDATMEKDVIFIG